MADSLFSSVLVANRGEIACRVIRTLRRMGIRSVAVYSDADAHARHVREADAAVRIGPADARASYLNIPALLDAARRTGAGAIHPGYGFLSENAAFAHACAQAGVVFIGPGEKALEVMGDKIRAKQAVTARGVPTTPGIARPGLSDDDLVAAAERIGYPVLVKPSAGGGGKGMVEVHDPGALRGELAGARRIAAAAFGDDTLFLERLVATPRHIEVQVLADAHGHVVHLGERECTLQRRHQKVIEEAPSALLDATTRARIGEAACEVARSVDYVGAGTVEFLVSDAKPDEFFFMEMNTRLQVEHPVTELVTGIDLVEQQVRIAAGLTLPWRQDQIALTGHAIEARIYAEDAASGFLPQTGTVLALREPRGEGIRVDSALIPGLRVGADYDPMLAKVVAHGADRAEAIQRLSAALRDTVVLGLTTNIEYLALLLGDADVRAGHLDTGLIERRLPSLAFRAPDDDAHAIAAILRHDDAWRAGCELWRRPSGWRLLGTEPARYYFGRPPVAVFVQGDPGHARVWVEHGRPEAAGLPNTGPGIPVRLLQRDAGHALIELDGVLREIPCAIEGEDVWLCDGSASWRLRASAPEDLRANRAGTQSAASPRLRTPMPGTVVAVAAADGAVVEPGEVVLTVEAMKMEHRITASVAGTVRISLAVGDLVRADQVVAVIEPAEPSSPAERDRPAPPSRAGAAAPSATRGAA